MRVGKALPVFDQHPLEEPGEEEQSRKDSQANQQEASVFPNVFPELLQPGRLCFLLALFPGGFLRFALRGSGRLLLRALVLALPFRKSGRQHGKQEQQRKQQRQNVFQISGFHVDSS